MKTVDLDRHPADVFREMLKQKGVQQKQFAKHIGLPYSMINKFATKQRPMKADFALLFEKALGVSADDWMKMQANYNLQEARKKEKIVNLLKTIEKV